jgi:hypothetical protein
MAEDITAVPGNIHMADFKRSSSSFGKRDVESQQG